MSLVGTTAIVFWILALAVAGWVLAAGALRRPRRRGGMGRDLYCGYCQWGLSRGAGYEVYRWEGNVFCSLMCLRRDGELRDREGRCGESQTL